MSASAVRLTIRRRDGQSETVWAEPRKGARKFQAVTFEIVNACLAVPLHSVTW